MPASDTRDEQQSGRLLGLLFWAGVGLAPVAALLLLLGGGDTTLRAAIGVLTLSVILIGLSITLRRDTDSVRIEIEDLLFEEIDVVRADVRDDIATAAHATHRSFGEKLHYLHEELAATRGELEATRAQLEAVRAEALRHPAGPPPGQGRQAPGPQHQPGPQGQPGRPGMPPGIVRHTETVQVTTRQTIVDPHADDNGRPGTVYASPGFDRGADRVPERAHDRGHDRGPDRGPDRDRGQRHDASEFTPRQEAPRPREESWTEQRLREQMERRRDAIEPAPAERWNPRDSWSDRAEPERWAERSGVDADRWSDREESDRRPAMRAGDRWTTVRNDERGREVRMGERRAALHSDETGTELRIEDRWAAVRREDARDGGGTPWRDDDRDEPRGGFWRDDEREPEDRGGRRAISAPDPVERWADYEEREDRDYRRR